MAVNKHLQLLRKTKPYASLNAAMTEMNAATAPKEGEPFLAYYSGETAADLSALIAIPGPDGTPKLYFLDKNEVEKLIDAAKTQIIGGASTSADTLSELEGLINSLKASDIAYESGNTDTIVSGATDVDEAIKAIDAAIADIKSGEAEYTIISADTESLGSNVKEAYQLQKTVGGVHKTVGQTIKIYKDSSLYNVYLGHVDDTITSSSNPTVIPGTGSEALCFIYLKADGTYELVAVNVEAFLQESEFKDGLQVVNNEVSVKLDTTAGSDSEKFLYMKEISGKNGAIALSGITEAISNAVEDLDAVESGSTTHVGVKVTEVDGVITAVDVTEDDIASADALTAETASRKAVTGINADTYTPNSGTNYISGSSINSLNAADIALDAQAKANADAIAAEVAARKDITGNDADTYVAPSSSNYISGSTSLKNAAVLLDAQVKVNATAIEALEDAKVSVSASTATESAKYLSVSVNGDKTVYTVQVSGIDAAITTAIEALDVTDTAVTDQFVTSVSEADGVITVTRTTPHASGITATAMSSGATQVAVTGTTVANQIKSLAETAKTIMDNAYSGVTAGNGIEVTSQTNGDTVAIKLDTTTATNNITSDMLAVSSNGLLLKDTWDCGFW